MHACAGANIDNMIGAANCFFIVFHHDNGVAEIPQMEEGGEQALIVPLMQPD